MKKKGGDLDPRVYTKKAGISSNFFIWVYVSDDCSTFDRYHSGLLGQNHFSRKPFLEYMTNETPSQKMNCKL